jgi:hypothetical protein
MPSRRVPSRRVSTRRFPSRKVQATERMCDREDVRPRGEETERQPTERRSEGGREAAVEGGRTGEAERRQRGGATNRRGDSEERRPTRRGDRQGGATNRRGDSEERRPTRRGDRQGEATDRRGDRQERHNRGNRGDQEATQRQPTTGIRHQRLGSNNLQLRTLISFYFITTVIYRLLQYYSTGNQSHISHEWYSC